MRTMSKFDPDELTRHEPVPQTQQVRPRLNASGRDDKHGEITVEDCELQELQHLDAHGTANDKIPDSTARASRKRRSSYQGWRFGLKCAAGASCTVLFINILATVVIVATRRGEINDGLVAIYFGNEKEINSCAIGVHLVLNLLSAVLLASSSYTMQCLAAPCRSELDEAHARRKKLDIGVPSVRNVLGGVSWKRSVSWLVLALSGLPLHLFFNAAIFTSLPWSDIEGAVVNEAFLDHPPDAQLRAWSDWKLQHTFKGNSSIETVTGLEFTIQEINSRISRLYASFSDQSAEHQDLIQHLPIDRCIEVYGSDFNEDRGNYLLLTADTGPSGNQTIFETYGFSAFGPDVIKVINGEYYIDSETFLFKSSNGTYMREVIASHQVTRCLSQMAPRRSRLGFSFQIAGLVIGCNLIQALSILYIIFSTARHSPLVTVGDAVASYLNTPDHGLAVEGFEQFGLRKPPTKRKVSQAVSRARWAVTISLPSIVILSACGIIAYGLYLHWGISANLEGFGQTDSMADFTGYWIRNLISAISPSNAYVTNAMVVNIPQLLCSMLFFSFNSLLTTLLMAIEWNRFYFQKQALRVSDPRGLQRSTHYLTVPLRYGIPLVLVSVLLHWLTSQSIFLIFRTDWDVLGEQTASDGDVVPQWTVGEPEVFYSVVPLLVATSIAITMLIVIVWTANRKLPGVMPIVGANSQLIAAVCQRPDDDVDAAYLPISWGELVHSEADGESRRYFTSKEVRVPPSVQAQVASATLASPPSRTRALYRSLKDAFALIPTGEKTKESRDRDKELEQQTAWLQSGT